MPPARKVPKLHKKAIVVKKGTEFSDILKQQVVIGKEIGQGGFGRIYEGIEVFLLFEFSSGFLKN